MSRLCLCETALNVCLSLVPLCWTAGGPSALSASAYILHAFSFMYKTFALTMVLLITLYLSEHKTLCLFLNHWQVGILTTAYCSVWKAFISCTNWLGILRLRYHEFQRLIIAIITMLLVLKGLVRYLSDLENLEWMKQQHKKPQDGGTE